MADENAFIRLMHSVRDMMGIDPSEISSDVPPRQDFPSAGEVDGSLAAYGSHVEPMLTAPARVRSLPMESAVNSINRGTLGMERPPVAGDVPGLDPKYVKNMKSTEGRVTAETQKALYQAYLAAQRSALAKLGFDPRRMITSPDSEYVSSATGVYVPEDDVMWVQPEYAPSNAVHESMHRGMEILRKDDPKELKNLQGGAREETIVRQMMLNKYGPVEAERNPEAVERAKEMLHYFREERNRLDELEKMAARLIAKRHPAGPR